MQGGAALVLLHAHAAAVGMDRVGAQALERSFVKQAVQLATRKADLGQGVAGMAAARLLVDELPEAVEKHAFLVFDADGFELLLQAQRRQLAHGVRQQCDADAEFLDFRHGFKNLALDAALMQRKRQAQPAYAAADDGNFHGVPVGFPV